MPRLSKDFKDEVNQEFREFDYIGRRVGLRIFVVILVIVLVGSIGGFAYKKWAVNKDREIFKNSISYTESAASFLAKSYREYNIAEDEGSKKAIMNYVIQRYPNLDANQIDNAELKNFYRKCMRGN